MARTVFENAKYVWLPGYGANDVNTYGNFAGIFEIDEDTIVENAGLKSALLNLSVENQYTLWVNGSFVNFGQYPDFPKKKTYDTLDLLPYVHKGRNYIALQVHYQGFSTQTYIAKKPGIIAEVVARFENGEELCLFSSDESMKCRLAKDYRSGNDYLITPQLDYVYHFDNRMNDFWMKEDYFGASFEKNGWKNAQAVPVMCEFSPRPVEKLLIKEPVKPKIAGIGAFIYSPSEKTDGSAAASMQKAFMGAYDKTLVCNKFSREWSKGDKRYKNDENTQEKAQECTLFDSIEQKNDNNSENINENEQNLTENDDIFNENKEKDKIIYEISEKSASVYDEFQKDGEIHIALDGNLEKNPCGYAQPLSGRGLYIILDLGREFAGCFTLSVKAAEGTVINYSWGEHLDGLRVLSEYPGVHFASTFICREGQNDFTHFGTRIACRYIEIFAETDEITILRATLLPTVYPGVDKTPDMKLSDKFHQKIFETSMNTLRLCMHEHFEDCPWREQALYSLDSRTQMLINYYAFGDYNFSRTSLKLLADGLRRDGLMELNSPGKCDRTIPSYTPIWITALCEYVTFSGDLDFGEEMFPVAETIIRSLWLMSKGNDLVPTPQKREHWNFYEWTSGLDGQDATSIRQQNAGLAFDAPLNAYYIMALRSMASLCRMLKEKSNGLPGSDSYREKCSWFEFLAETASAEFHRIFYNKELGVFHSYFADNRVYHVSELTNSLAVLAGICTSDKEAEQIAAFLLDDSDKDYKVKIAISNQIFKYDALMQINSRNIGYIISDIEEKWGKMLLSGATTFWETEKGSEEFECLGSLCHGWSAVPAYIYYRYICGVYPEKPGFDEKISVNVPDFSDCDFPLYADASIPTPAGPVHINTFRKKDSK